ncbi:putative calcium-binding protein [Nymphaea thermarum]|nr:putative calcium-binding protein [Nymphaea thermarum]
MAEERNPLPPPPPPPLGSEHMGTVAVLPTAADIQSAVASTDSSRSSNNTGLGFLSKWVRVSRTLADLLPGRRPKSWRNRLEWLPAAVSSMKVTNQLEQVFKLIDENGDGKISCLELGRLLRRLGHERVAAVEVAEEMVKEMDYDGDGLIGLQEFMEVVVDGSRGEGGFGSHDDLREAFLIFDSDRDGYISAVELQRVMISLGDAGCTLHDCLLMIKGVDKDGDGQVDFEEFREMMMRCSF